MFLADTSAYTVARRSPVAEMRLRKLAADGVLATFVTVDLELGYSARDPGEHQGIFRVRGQLIQLACIDEIALRAREVQALMAARSQHRAAGVMDLLTAAAAEHYGVSVLHYDADFDHIAAITGQAVDWVAPRGSAA
jgi:predicted nucleic acid-binding protein